MANQMQLNQSDEWQAMIDEFEPNVTNAHAHVWVQVTEVS